MTRKLKLRLFQISLLIIGITILYFTYYKKDITTKTEIIPPQLQEKIKQEMAKQPEGYDIFFNIEYSGLDFSGNRYILKSEKAYNENDDQKIVNLISVEAYFYFKDNTVLKIVSDYGKYDNKNLDMYFYDNIVADYMDSVLYAQKAVFSNQNSNLTISEKVKLEDKRGTLYADKLFFDIKNQTLNVTALDNNKINANINLK